MGDIDISTDAADVLLWLVCNEAPECGDPECIAILTARALADDRDQWRARAEAAEAALQEAIDWIATTQDARRG